MPTSSANKADRQAGFSLVELLAVLAIMSLMVGAVVMNLPQGPSETDRASAALVAQVQARLDAAARDNRMLGLGVDQEGLSLFRDENGEVVGHADLPWPDDVRVRVRRGDDRLDLPEEAVPQNWVEPYGAVPDLRITLSGARETYVLRFDDRGRFMRETPS